MITADMRGGLFSSKEEERFISCRITTTIAYNFMKYYVLSFVFNYSVFVLCYFSFERFVSSYMQTY